MLGSRESCFVQSSQVTREKHGQLEGEVGSEGGQPLKDDRHIEGRCDEFIHHQIRDRYRARNH